MPEINTEKFNTDLLNRLTRDRWSDLSDLAKELDVTPVIVENRLHTLELKGIIKGYVPQLNYTALGYDLTAVVRINVPPNKLADATAHLRGNQRLITIYQVTGNHDLVAIGKFEDTSEMNDQLQTLRSRPEIERATASVALEVNREFEPFELDSSALMQS